MINLKELLEASILDIEGTFKDMDKFEKDIVNVNQILKATSLKEFNTCVENFIKLIDVKTKPALNDFVARIEKQLISVNNKEEWSYRIRIGYRGKRKIYMINFSPWLNKVHIEDKYMQISKPYNMENAYYGIIPKSIENVLKQYLQN